MADTYLGRLQSMFSDPYMAGGGRPVTGALTPMQQAALAGPQGMAPAPSPMATGELSRIAPGRAWPTPASQNFQTVGGPRQVGGPLRPAAPYTPNFTMPGPSYPIEPMRYPAPAMAQPSGMAPMAGQAPAKFGGMVSDVTPRLPAPAASSPGLMSRMLGIGGRMLGRVAGPVGLGMTAMDAINAAGESMPGQMMGAMSPDGFASALMDVANTDNAAQAPDPATPAAPYQPAWAPAPRVVQMGNTRQLPRSQPARAVAPTSTAPASGVVEGQNANIGDDVRQRAMAWLALNQSGM